jgi:putative addiction module killer protein
MRIHFGPGYRVDFPRTADVVYVLLCGGTKRGQQRDIAKAQAMTRQLKED